jgi:hypothetical protein
MTIATHHPYGTPPGYHPPFPGKDPQSQYWNALQYSDRAIGSLLESLSRKGLLENTVIAVTGDHGEAFGTIHAMNFVHKNFLYEENVRSFLLLSDPRWKLNGPIVSSRICTNGDIMQTLLAYVRAAEPSLPGRNLLEESWQTRPVFFYKLAIPEQWGLRDGNWKYVGDMRTGKAELYDLATDPLEQRNLANENVTRVAQYEAQCQEWYVRSDADYIARVPEYRLPGGRTLQPAEFRSPGPKTQSVGMIDHGEFAERTTIPPGARPVAWDSWVADLKPHHARWLWHSPSGAETWSDLDVHEDWSVTYVPYPGALPMSEGEWKVTLWRDGRSELSSKFRVE